MSVVHAIAAFSKGGVSGLQASQSDWSPYAVHFTSFSAMARLRTEFQQGAPPHAVEGLLAEADELSFQTVGQIAKSGMLLMSSPAEKDGIPACVCLSECVIGGLISNAERYGRFGFVFEKSQLFQIGGGPCLYLNAEEYANVVEAFKGSDDPVKQRLFGRSNVLSPAGAGGKIQDFSHEREWRVFSHIEFAQIPPRFILAPVSFLDRIEDLFGGTIRTIPIDTMFEWGA